LETVLGYAVTRENVKMRDLRTLDRFRLTGMDIIVQFGSVGDDTSGFFELPSPVDGGTIRVIAAVAMGFDHVSVSRQHRRHGMRWSL
jgi:hypothetical protein